MKNNVSLRIRYFMGWDVAHGRVLVWHARSPGTSHTVGQSIDDWLLVSDQEEGIE